MQRAAEGGIAAADTDVNGLMRANRTRSCPQVGKTHTVRYSGRVCQYAAMRGTAFAVQLGWYRRKSSPVPFYWDGSFLFLLGTLNSEIIKLK